MEKRGEARLKGQGGQMTYEEYAVCKAASEVVDAPKYVPAPTIDFRTPTEGPASVSPSFGEVIQILFGQLRTDVLRPLLTAATRDELFADFAERWAKYVSLSNALNTLVSNASTTQAFAAQSVESSIGFISSCAATLGGPAAAEEVRFAAETYLAAIRLTARISGLGAATNLEEDWHHWKNFTMRSALHNLGAAMLCEAGTSGQRASAVGLEVAFEFFRGGALDAYVAARSAVALREPNETVSEEPLPFDDEDYALASAP
jgi:hypothetical protein